MPHLQCTIGAACTVSCPQCPPCEAPGSMPSLFSTAFWTGQQYEDTCNYQDVTAVLTLWLGLTVTLWPRSVTPTLGSLRDNLTRIGAYLALYFAATFALPKAQFGLDSLWRMPEVLNHCDGRHQVIGSIFFVIGAMRCYAVVHARWVLAGLQRAFAVDMVTVDETEIARREKCEKISINVIDASENSPVGSTPQVIQVHPYDRIERIPTPWRPNVSCLDSVTFGGIPIDPLSTRWEEHGIESEATVTVIFRPNNRGRAPERMEPPTPASLDIPSSIDHFPYWRGSTFGMFFITAVLTLIFTSLFSWFSFSGKSLTSDHTFASWSLMIECVWFCATSMGLLLLFVGLCAENWGGSSTESSLFEDVPDVNDMLRRN